MKRLVKILFVFMFFSVITTYGNISSANTDFTAEITSGAKSEYKVNSIFSIGGNKKVETGTGNTTVREEETFNATSSWHFFARSGSLTYLHKCSPGGSACANTDCTTSGSASSSNKNAGIDYALSKLDDLKGNAIYNLRAKAEKEGYTLDEDSIYKIGNGARVHYFACDNGYNDAVVRLRVYGKGYKEVASEESVTKLSTISLSVNGFTVDKTSIGANDEYTWNLTDIKITSLDYDYLMNNYNPTTNTFDGKIIVTSNFEGVETTKEIIIPFPAYSLNVSSKPQNGGKVSLDSGKTYSDSINKKYPIGYVVTGVTAKSEERFDFTNWTEGNSIIDVSKGITMNQNRTIYANFIALKNYYTLTLEISPSDDAGTREMYVDNEWQSISQKSFEEGTTVMIRSISKDSNRYVLLKWEEDGKIVDVTNGVYMDRNRTIKVVYDDLGEYYEEYRHTCSFGDIDRDYSHNLSISMAPNKGETGFLPGEIINSFDGNACFYTKNGTVGCTNHVQTKYRVYKTGQEVLLETNTNYNCTETNTISESGYLDITLKFDGIKLSFNGSRVDNIFLAVNQQTGGWTTKNHYSAGFKVESFDRKYYDSNVGKHYGIVRVSSNGDDCTREIRIYVGDIPSTCTLTVYPSDATYASNNNTSKTLNSVTVNFGESAYYGFKNTTIPSKYTGKFKEAGTNIIYDLNNTATSGVITSMTRDITLVAVEKNELTVDISPREGGKIYVNGLDFTPGNSIFLGGNETVRIKVVANSGSTVGNWMNENTGSIINSSGDVVQKGTTEFEYKMPDDGKNHTVIACVENVPPSVELPYKVTYKVEPSEGGTEPLGTNNYAGETVKLPVNVNPGWVFDTREGFAWQFYKDTGDGLIKENYNVTNELFENENTYYDLNGEGQFIMPNYDVIAVVHYIKIQDENSLTVYIHGEGTVTVDSKQVTSGETVRTTNDSVNVVASPATGYEFEKAVNGEATWEVDYPNNEFRYTLVKEEDSIHIYFSKINPDNETYYILYVTATEGGEAWTEGNANHPKNSIIVTDEGLNKKYTINDVAAKEEFRINYKVAEGYEFYKWEYRPYIGEKDSDIGFVEGDKYTDIYMPYSNLTVTAIFKKSNSTLNPTLAVTSNNETWGTAYTEINNKPTKMNKKYDVSVNDEFDLVYESNTGFYFTNWQYSTKNTPFIDTDRIRMSAEDLEVKAMFAPIPPQDEELGHDIVFEAEPPEGGSIPENLEDILPGGQVTIAVTPNKGWAFDYWYFKYADGTVVPADKMPIIKYDKDGTGYFIMPDYDVIAVAVFKKLPTYKLYVSYMTGGSAWTYSDNNSKVNYIEAIPGENYVIAFKSDTEFVFDGWEYKFKVVNGDKYPGINEKSEHNLNSDSDILVMPHSDITVTAKFKEKDPDKTNTPKLKITSNNYYWGTAWLELDNNVRVDWEPESGFLSSNKEGAVVVAGKSYTIRFEAKTGYKFTEWIPQDKLTNWYVSDDFKTGWAVVKMPDYNYEIMTYFAPDGDGVKGYSLTVVADPEDGGTVTGGGSNIIAGTLNRITAKANSDFEFKYWYKVEDGKEIKLPQNKVDNFEMPKYDVTLYAKFKEDSKPTNDYYQLDIKVEGTGSVIAKIGEKEVTITGRYSRSIKEGTAVELNIADYRVFNGWTVNNRSKGKVVPLRFTMNENKDVVASFSTSEYQLNITVNGNGNVSGTVKKDGNLINNIYVTDTYTALIEEGSEVSLYPVNNGQDFSGWTVNNSRAGKGQLKFVMNENKNVIATFGKTNVTTDFNIVSVRDLRWKDDFIIDGTTDLSGLTYGVPETDDVMLNSGSDKDKVKMGYAVEFELNSIAVPSGDASLYVDVTLLDADGTKISWDKVYDGLTGEKIDDRFKSFSIDGTNTTFQGEEIPMTFTNNGTNMNLIKWRWLYYLPAKIDIVPATGLNVDDNIIVAFSVKLKSGNTVVNDYVKYEMYLDNDGWNGKTFSYSMKDSLLADIYDNAQN